MTIAEYERKAEKIRTLRWLEGIAEEYRKIINRIDNEKDYFRVTGIMYVCRNDGEVLDINSHKSIPYQYIRDGLAAALANITDEITTLTKEIES